MTLAVSLSQTKFAAGTLINIVADVEAFLGRIGGEGLFGFEPIDIGGFDGFVGEMKMEAISSVEK